MAWPESDRVCIPMLSEGLNSNSARDSMIAKRASGMDPLNCAEAAVDFQKDKGYLYLSGEWHSF